MFYFLIFGGNVGNSKEIFKLAREKIKLFGKLLYEGKLYKTKPYGIKNQKFFYNQGFIFKLSFSPFLALKFFQSLERIYGKKKKGSWGPRYLDIDIVYTYPLYKINTNFLKIPHPQIYERDYSELIFKELISFFKNKLKNKV